MKESVKYSFGNAMVQYYFNQKFSQLGSLTDKKRTVLITDENIFRLHGTKFKGWNTIVLKPGEAFKIQATVDTIIEQLIAFEADRQTMLVGIGGGVITDLTGYVASVYMRGIKFGFVPTTLLAMVDAAIGGKNGIDVGPYKNMVGVIRQPEFLLYDISLLFTLPEKEWSNGFAEIIKHACIKDATAFKMLQQLDVQKVQKNKKVLAELIERNARLKSAVVKKDEFEKGDRKLLNFGHTLGHALETQYELMHGEAVAIGMTYACRFSEDLLGFKGKEKVIGVIQQFGLPTYSSFDADQVLNILKMDKKRVRDEINYILLERIGKAIILPMPLTYVGKMIRDL
jgi:3-dehydroquinate synthase